MLAQPYCLEFAAYEGDARHPLLHMVINSFDAYVDETCRPLLYMYGQVRVASLSGFDWNTALPLTYVNEISLETGEDNEKCIAGCIDEPQIVEVCKKFFTDISDGEFEPSRVIWLSNQGVGAK